MNYLAHLYLSGNEEEVIFGNFIGDSIKGKDFSYFPKGIAKGITLHRMIDDFTDRHLLFRENKAFFRAEFGLYSGIIADVVHDYFLAKNWNKYANESLHNYAARMYTLLSQKERLMPSNSLRFYHHMVEYNRLYNYQFKESITEVLSMMSYRIKAKINMSKAMVILETHEVIMENNFFELFEDLKKETEIFLLAN